MNTLIITLGLVLAAAISTEAIKCIQCINCPYSQVVGMAPSDCGGSDKYCTIISESGLFNRGCATVCSTGSGSIDNNQEGVTTCCDKDGCNSAPGVLAASTPLLLIALAFLRL